jgi:hypothetical protein
MVPSHLAPVLPLKTWRPLSFSGLALCLGAVAPDLEFILRIDNDWIVSHTLAAQLFFTVPLVLLLHAALTSLVLPWLVPLLPRGGPLYLQDLALVRPARTASEWLVVAVSGFIGGMTHFVLDGVTHGNHSGWAVPFLPFLTIDVPLPNASMPLYDLLHGLGTIVLGFVASLQILSITKRRLLPAWCGETASVREATAAEKRGALRFVLFCATLGAAVGALRLDADDLWIERPAFGALTFVLFGLILASGADRLAKAWARRRPLAEAK